eukprot:13738212-Ditylum_brightwellii.AAC.2
MGRTVWKNFKLITSCSDDPVGRKQQGGTCIGFVNDIVGRHIASSEDETGICGWNYVQIAGKDQRVIKLVTTYKPCVQSDTGDDTVTAQKKITHHKRGQRNKPKKGMGQRSHHTDGEMTQRRNTDGVMSMVMDIGMLKFNDRINLDHRGMFCDFNSKYLL